MIPNINPEHINQEILEEQIKALESGYVETLINLIKGPLFIKACKDDLDTASEEKKEAILKALIQHESNEKQNNIAINQLNTIITEAKTYLTK